jgi:hypothetical protein
MARMARVARSGLGLEGQRGAGRGNVRRQGKRGLAWEGADACHMPDILGACGYASDRLRVPPDAKS